MKRNYILTLTLAVALSALTSCAGVFAPDDSDSHLSYSQTSKAELGDYPESLEIPVFPYKIWHEGQCYYRLENSDIIMKEGEFVTDEGDRVCALG